MNALPTYLWKEWRDHRAIVVAYLVGAPLLIGIASLAIGKEWWSTRQDWPTIGAFVGFAVAALAFGADLVAGELRRRKLGFLARLPGDLSGAFVAKLAYFVAVLIGFAFWTYAAAAIASNGTRGSPWFPPLAWSKYATLWWAALVVAGWLLAVSSWMPRGTFALPATVLALAALLAPVFGAFASNPTMTLRPLEFETMAFWLALSGPFVAAASFTCGWRQGGTVRSRLAWSLGPAIIAFAPVWAWAGTRVHEHRHLDPSEASFRLHAAALGTGGRFAFVNGYHDLTSPTSSLRQPEWGASHPMIVELETGSWRAAGGPDHLFWSAYLSRNPAGVDEVMLLAGKHDARLPIASQCVDCFDGSTGLPLTGEQWKRLLRGARSDDSQLPHSSASTFLPDGRQVWVANWKIVERTRDGVQGEVVPDIPDRWALPLGAGVEGENAWYDCTRRRAWRKQELASLFHQVVLVRAGRWIVVKRNTATREGDLANTMLWDPETRELAPVPGLSGNLLRGLHPDGRLLVVETASTEGAAGAFVLLDPESGSRRDLPLPAPLAAKLHGGWLHGFTDSGDLLIKLYASSDDESPFRREVWIVRLDPRKDVLACVGPFARGVSPDFLGCPDRDTVLFVADDRQLLRAHFDGRPTETLFPR